MNPQQPKRNNEALEKWLIGLVKAGRPDGLAGSIMLLFYKTGAKSQSCEVLAAMPSGVDVKELARQIHRLAKSIEDGDGMPMSQNHGQIIELN